MAQRRMFSQSIVGSDVFMDMPHSSQNLYMHLCMNADDDGFVNPKKIVRMINSADDDLLLLIAKRYVLRFDSGVVVIKHWHINNFIRKDRYVPSTYKTEFKTLTRNEFGAYTEIDRILAVVDEITTNSENKQGRSTNGQPNVIPVVNLGKDRLGKVSKNTTNVVKAEKPAKTPSKEINRIFEYWESVLGYKIQSKIKMNRFAASNLLKKHGQEKLEKLIQGVLAAQNDQYAPRISDFCGLQAKTNDLIVWGRTKQMGKETKVWRPTA